MSQEKINDGGTAFPVMHQHTQHGMMLRDCFAAKAMQAILQCEHRDDIPEEKVDVFLKLVSEYSYKMADSMIEKRESQNG